MERSRADNDDDNDDDLQRRVLQSTLDEVAARDERATDCCVICLEVKTEPCELLPCGHHNFDYLCAISWLYETPVCPLCKAAVSGVLHGPPESRQTTLFSQTKPKPKPPAPPPARVFPPSLDGRRIRPPSRRPRARPPMEHGFPAGELEAVVGGGRRREVYLHKRYSKHVGSNRLSLYRELTPATFRSDRELVSRARMWIRRELQVFSFLALDETDAMMPRPGDANARAALERRRAGNAEFLLEYTVAVLKSVDMVGSAGQAEDLLSDFLGRENTRLFLHELRAWLRSPYTKLEDWDRAVQYDAVENKTPATTTATTVTTDSSNTRQTRKGDRYTNDRHNDRYRGRGDSYRPDSAQKPQDKRHSPRYEPYRNRNMRHTNEARA